MLEYSKIIILKSVYGKVGQKYFLQPARNPKTGRYPNHIKSVDSNGDLILSDVDKNEMSKGKIFISEDELIECTDGTSFNLDDDLDKARWGAIEFSRLIAKERGERDLSGNLIIDGKIDASTGNNISYGIAELYVYRPSAEAEQKATKTELRFKALEYVMKDSADNRRNMCRIMGKDSDRIPDPDIQNYLTEKAEKDPQSIIDLYTGDDTHVRLMFVDAKRKGIIRLKDKLYIFGDDIILGATDDASVMYLKNHKEVMDLIKEQLMAQTIEVENPNFVKRTATKK